MPTRGGDEAGERRPGGIGNGTAKARSPGERLRVGRTAVRPEEQGGAGLESGEALQRYLPQKGQEVRLGREFVIEKTLGRHAQRSTSAIPRSRAINASASDSLFL